MNDRDEDIKKLCDTVRETSFAAHRFLRSGHVAQLLGYLRSSKCEHGMLINFGGRRLQVKKYILTEEAY